MTPSRRVISPTFGDGTVDNQLGMTFGTLAGTSDLDLHAADVIAAGVIASSIELQAPRLDQASKAGATYYGADSESATVAGGSIADGAFESNRTRTTHVPGMAMLYLPVFADADPSLVELDAMELDLTPDGAGGYDAIVRGGVTNAHLAPELCTGTQQMIANDPIDHYGLASILDKNRDGQITCDEVAHNVLLESLLAPDVTLFGQPMVSVAFAVHLVPCEIGSCASSTPADRCHDRARDGDEVDVDCGGSCAQKCTAGAACTAAADCASNARDAGHCRAPSCSDGVRDGLETDVDCGWNCAPCAVGKLCYDGSDCQSGATCTQGRCTASP